MKLFYIEACNKLFSGLFHSWNRFNSKENENYLAQAKFIAETEYCGTKSKSKFSHVWQKIFSPLENSVKHETIKWLIPSANV